MRGRYRYFRNFFSCAGLAVVGANTVGASGLPGEDLTILQLQRLHRYLSDATKHLNSHYSPQLLCWLVCLLMDILLYAFFALFIVFTPKVVILQCVLFSCLSIEIIALSRVCHLTCDQVSAGELGRNTGVFMEKCSG